MGEEIELEEANVLVAGARPETAGNGRSEPATVVATTVSRELGVGVREREGEPVWFDQTGLGRVDPLGLTHGPRVCLQILLIAGT